MSEGDDLRRGLDEYREIGTNWRYWGDVRFKQMTVYFTATGGLIAAAFSRGWQSTTANAGSSGGTAAPVLPLWATALALATIGIVLTITFLILEERATFYRRAFMSCAKALEDTLGMPQRQYVRTHNPISADSGGAYRLLLCVMVGVWLSYLSAMTTNAGWVFVVAMVIAVLFYAAVRRGASLSVPLADARGAHGLSVIAEQKSITLVLILRLLGADIRQLPARLCGCRSSTRPTSPTTTPPSDQLPDKKDRSDEDPTPDGQ